MVRQSKGELEGSEGVEQTLSFLREYALTKEDMDSVFELTQWPGMLDPLKNVNSKVKAALTRAYNKSSEKAVGSYAVAQSKGKSKKKKNTDENEDDQPSDNERYSRICLVGRLSTRTILPRNRSYRTILFSESV